MVLTLKPPETWLLAHCLGSDDVAAKRYHIEVVARRPKAFEMAGSHRAQTVPRPPDDHATRARAGTVTAQSVHEAPGVLASTAIAEPGRCAPAPGVATPHG